MTKAHLAPGAIGVSATMFWTKPGAKRPYDELILREHPDPAAWSDGMDVEMRRWLSDGRAETQGLLGELVEILDERQDWLKVAAVAQKTAKDPRGYPGWVPAWHVFRDAGYVKAAQTRAIAVVAAARAMLYGDETLSQPLGEISYQTRLPIMAEHPKAIQALLPDGRSGYLNREAVKKEAELSFSASQLLADARRFLGLRYVWAGTSAFGFDCSGFTMRLYQSQGITIPRDANEQAQTGTPVTKEDLQPGDLLFFATEGGTGFIHHVTMYTGGGLMIHAPNSASAVREEALAGSPYEGEFWGARRYA